MAQHEILEAGPLLDERGSLRELGWSRRPVLAYDRAAIDAPVHRISELDRYIAFSKDYVFSVSVSDDGYLGALCATIIDLNDGSLLSQSYPVRLPLGSLSLPASSMEGDVKYRNPSYSLDFALMESGARIVKVDLPTFAHGSGLRGALVLSKASQLSETSGDDCLCSIKSWKKDPLAFSYSCVQAAFLAEGMMQGADMEMAFVNGESFAILDWRRLVRPKKELRFWGAASGLVEDASFGFSIGYGSSDDEASTENALFYEGKLHKLGAVTFQINPRDWMAPWHFTSDDGRLEMELKPLVLRTEKSSLIFYSSKRRQVFGRFSGKALLDDGRSIEFSDLTGLAERLKTRG
ncbi:DUF2804 domain-containing protein [Treponema sp.]